MFVPVGLVRAAMRWWEGKRPFGWTTKRHIQNPTVNCMSTREDALALKCMLIAKHRLKKRK